MQIDHERVFEIGKLLDCLTITHFYRNGFYIFAPSTVATLNHGGAWKNTIASAGFCYLAARQGFLEPFSSY